MIRSARFPLLVVLLGALILGVTGSAAAKSYSADRFDVTAQLLPDRSLTVEERIVFRFEGGTYTYVFRELPQDRSDGVRDIAAEMDGLLFPPGAGPGFVEVKQGRAVRVTWHFQPTAGTHTFTLRYRLSGVVTAERDGDVLAWRALPGAHKYRIREAQADVALPRGARLAAPPSLRPDAAVLHVDYAPDGQVARRIVASARDLRENDTIRLDVRLAPGALASDPPAWQRKAAERAQRGPYLLIVAAAVVVLGFGWLATFWSAWRRSTDDRRSARAPHVTPPDPLMPVAIAARLAGRSAPGPHYVATMVDLAARGVIAVDEAPGRARIGRRKFVARLAQAPPGLRPHETAWLDVAFGVSTSRNAEVPLATVQRRFAHLRNAFRRAVQEEMRHLGLIDPERIAARRVLGRAALAALLLAAASVGVAVVLVSRFGGWAAVIPVSLAVVAAACGIAAGSFSILTRAGERLADEWKAYFAEIRRGAKENGANGPMPADWLPYAVAAAVGAAWVRKLMAAPGRYAPPAWFHAGSPGEDDSAVFVAFLGSHASTHGDGSTAGAGGGAAAGGGSSGAG